MIFTRTPKAFFLHYVVTSSEKHPLNLSLPDVVTPRFMVDYQSSSKSFPIGSFRSQYQVDIEQISSSQVVNIPSFYKLLYINKDIASFHDCNLDETCLEDLLLPYLKSCPCFPLLTKIIKFMMALLHGQSAAETRVSANKNLLVENLHKKSI